MQSEENIRKKIVEVENRLQQIHHAIEKEKARPFFQRRFNICRFLDIEKRIYRAMLTELNWILHA